MEIAGGEREREKINFGRTGDILGKDETGEFTDRFRWEEATFQLELLTFVFDIISTTKTCCFLTGCLCFSVIDDKVNTVYKMDWVGGKVQVYPNNKFPVGKTSENNLII